jgi:hypothetical protein
MSLGNYRDKGECAEGWDLKNRLEVRISLLLPDFYEIRFTRTFVAKKES